MSSSESAVEAESCRREAGMYPDWDGGKEEGIVGEVEDSKGGEAVRKKKKKV